MREAAIIGVPTDYGANRRGVDMGPSAIRYAGLVNQVRATGRPCHDHGDVVAPPPAHENPATANSIRCLPETRAVTQELSDQVAQMVAADHLPIVLGGDHSIAIGTVQGSAEKTDIGMIWFDAHADFNTPSTSPSGNIHGMAVAAALGHASDALEWAAAPGLREENIVYVGLRNLDEEERNLVAESDMTVFTMHDLDVDGVAAVVSEALEIAGSGVDGIHLSLDMDWLDPVEAPGVGTPVPGGVTYREAHLAMELVAEHDAENEVLRSVDVVEVNPVLDQGNRTAALAAELAASALGKQIL